ncbi:MAG: hypothetical protein HRT72_08180 [Flavobacteriales bacterium]|nr:hypothetical protein [Flavobacteriales bacterium]
MAELTEEEWRIKEIKNKIFISRWSVIVGLLTLFGSLWGFFNESYENRIQLKREFATTLHNDKIKRMTEIASEFDRIYLSTLRVFTEVDVDKLTLGLELDAVSDQLRSSEIGHKRIVHLEESLDSFSDLLLNEDIGVWQLKKGILLQENWKVIEDAVTPDFEMIYGEELSKEWKVLSTSAWTVLNNKFAITSQSPDLIKFKLAGNVFQKKLYGMIKTTKEAGAGMII